MDNRKPFPLLSTLMVLAILAAAGAVMAGAVNPAELYSRLMGNSKVDYSRFSTKPAEKKPFLISLAVQGNLDSMGNATLSSGVEGTTTIISIIPEGTMVEKDQVVCELDSSALREKAKQQEITVTQADSAMAQANEKLQITKTQNESDIAAAELKLDLAKLDLEKYEDGEYLQMQKEMKGNVEIAKEELVRANENFEFTKLQVKKGYRTQNEMEANRIAKQQAELKKQGAEEKLRVLEQYDYKRKITELKANAHELERELERVKLKAASAQTQAEKDYEAQQLTSGVEHEKLDRLNKQIAACTMKAPQAGQVVYANMQSSNSFRSSGEQIEQGSTVRERQAIINLPDLNQMKVDCRIHESLIGNIRIGLPARITISSFLDHPFKGVVSLVSSVPMTGRWPNTDLREYETEIKLVDDPDLIRKLRPGLTAQVEIMVDNRQDVLQVPVQAVLAIADKQIGYVLTPAGPERRELLVGQSNQSMVEIKEGVKEGEQVILNARSQFPEEIALLEAQLNAEKSKRTSAEKMPDIPAAPAAPAPGSPGAGGPGGRGPGGGGFDPKARFEQQDANKDGKITEDEASDRMKGERFKAADSNGDGGITLDEYTAMVSRFAGGAGGGPGGPSGRPQGGGPEGGRPEGGRPEGGRPPGGRPEGGRPPQ